MHSWQDCGPPSGTQLWARRAICAHTTNIYICIYSLPVGVLSCDIQVELSSTKLEVVHTIASRFVMRSRGHTETTRENSPSPWREQTPAVL